MCVLTAVQKRVFRGRFGLRVSAGRGRFLVFQGRGLKKQGYDVKDF